MFVKMASFRHLLFTVTLFGLSMCVTSGYVVCAYKNEMLSGDDEVVGSLQSDNETVVCDGKTDWCFSLWYSRPGQDEIIIAKQGCWEYEAKKCDCDQPTCNSVEPPIYSMRKAHNVSSQFCCCTGDKCNINMTSSYVYVPVPPTDPSTSGPMDIDYLSPAAEESWTTIIIVVVIILCLCIAIPVIFVFLRMYHVRSIKANKDHLHMIEAAPPEPSVDLDQLKVLNLVGQGRYCNCYRGLLEEREVAVKIFAGASRQCYLNEVDIYNLPHIEHPNVLKFIGSSERMGIDNWPEYLLVVEYMRYGSLMNYLKENTYDWLGMCRLAQTAAAGLAHLHQGVDKGGFRRPAIVHRDINSRNILIKSDLTCVIGDFGFAMRVFGSSVVRDGDEDNSTITDVGTVRYMSPEVLDGAVNLRDCESALKQVDIYALGLVIWEIGTRCRDLYPGADVPPYKLPFSNTLCQHPTFEDMQVHVSRGRKRPPFPDAWKENNQALRSLKETIEDCWDHDSEARLTALCVEERIIELMVLWDKHRTVSPTINPTSGSITTVTGTHQIQQERPLMPVIIDTAASQRSYNRCDSIAREHPAGICCGPPSTIIEKNERQRLLSPDTISTSLSNQSDLNLIDLSAIAPSVDPKNLHNSDENIERFTSDLKYGRPFSTPIESSSGDGVGFSEPTTSPSQPLVMHEMRPSLGGDQMTDNLGVWSRRHNLHRPTSLPVWGQLTVNEARARSNPNTGQTDQSHDQHAVKPIKPDVNKQRQQAQAAEQLHFAARPKCNCSPKEIETSCLGNSTADFKGSCSSLQSSSSSEDSVNSSDSDHSRRPKTLPLPSKGQGSKKKLVAVYIPDSGVTTKVQTGIPRMDCMETQCHPVRVTTNGANCSKTTTTASLEPKITSRAKVQPSEADATKTRPLSWSVGDKSCDDPDSETALNGNSKSRDHGLNGDNKKTKRKVTPYRIGGSKKLSIYNGTGGSSSDCSSQSSLCQNNSDTSDESTPPSDHDPNHNPRDQYNGTMAQNGHPIQHDNVLNSVVPPTRTANINGLAENAYRLVDSGRPMWSEPYTDKSSRANYQVSCV